MANDKTQVEKVVHDDNSEKMKAMEEALEKELNQVKDALTASKNENRSLLEERQRNQEKIVTIEESLS